MHCSKTQTTYVLRFRMAIQDLHNIMYGIQINLVFECPVLGTPFYLSCLNFTATHLFFSKLSKTVNVSLSSVFDSRIGSGLEELQGGVAGNILTWNFNCD